MICASKGINCGCFPNCPKEVCVTTKITRHDNHFEITVPFYVFQRGKGYSANQGNSLFSYIFDIYATKIDEEFEDGSRN